MSDKWYRDDLIRGMQAAKNLTNAEVAALAEVDANTVSAIRNGKTNVGLHSLRAVVTAVGLSLEQVFSTDLTLAQVNTEGRETVAA